MQKDSITPKEKEIISSLFATYRTIVSNMEHNDIKLVGSMIDDFVYISSVRVPNKYQSFAKEHGRILLNNFESKKSLLVSDYEGNKKRQKERLEGTKSIWVEAINKSTTETINEVNSAFDSYIPTLNPDNYNLIPDQFNETTRYLRDLITNNTVELKKEELAKERAAFIAKNSIEQAFMARPKEWSDTPVPEIARACGVSTDELQAALLEMRNITPVSTKEMNEAIDKDDTNKYYETRQKESIMTQTGIAIDMSESEIKEFIEDIKEIPVKEPEIITSQQISANLEKQKLKELKNGNIYELIKWWRKSQK